MPQRGAATGARGQIKYTLGMSDIKRDGGPAFPCSQLVGSDGRGMFLRDWFAGQVICGRLGDPSSFYDPENAAQWAYRLADAMLKEREK